MAADRCRPWNLRPLSAAGALIGWLALPAQAQSWLGLSPDATPPAGRFEHAFAFDPATDRMMIFGGAGGTSMITSPPMLGDVWVLSSADGIGATPAWTQLQPTGGPIPPRSQTSAVYDATRNRLIVFGGNLQEGNCDSTSNDVWVLSNANGMEAAEEAGISDYPVFPIALQFRTEPGVKPTPQQLNLTNLTSLSLDYSVSDTESWLLETPSTGSLGAGQSVPIQVEARLGAPVGCGCSSG